MQSSVYSVRERESTKEEKKLMSGLKEKHAAETPWSYLNETELHLINIK